MPRGPIRVTILRVLGQRQKCDATLAIETSLEVETLAAGGLMPLILSRVLGQTKAA